MQTAMEESAGIYRTGAALTAGAEAVGRLQAHAQRLLIEDRSRTFNTELTAALELGYMLELAQVILRSAEARTESRGPTSARTIRNATTSGSWPTRSRIVRTAARRASSIRP